MSIENSKLKISQRRAERALKTTNERIEELGKCAAALYGTLTRLQDLFAEIRNVPADKRSLYEKAKKQSLLWKQQAEKIEADYHDSMVKNASGGAAGVGVGVAVAALGPTAAMGIATTFGVASTGTAISALSGAAATNAALAWLGGGALAAGGGGMAAGQALLAFAGPLGWTIAGIALLGSGWLFYKAKREKERLEEIYTLIAERDEKSYKLAIVELDERIKRMREEKRLMAAAVADVQTFGLDYSQMTEAQQYALGSYLNLMFSTTQLLINPIMGLTPKYTEENYKKFASSRHVSCSKESIIFFANFLYGVPLSMEDKKLLWKSFAKNKKLLESLDLEKEEFAYDYITCACDALFYQRRYG